MSNSVSGTNPYQRAAAALAQTAQNLNDAAGDNWSTAGAHVRASGDHAAEAGGHVLGAVTNAGMAGAHVVGGTLEVAGAGLNLGAAAAIGAVGTAGWAA